MTKWKRMRRREERKRMQGEEQKQSIEQEPVLVKETPNDVQISHSSLSEEDGFGEMVQLERGDCLIIVKYESTGPPPAFSIEWTNPQGERSLLPLDLVRPDPALMIFVDHGREHNLR